MSYHRNIHYNSVVNPNKATIGVGLGLPAFKPGVRTLLTHGIVGTRSVFFFSPTAVDSNKDGCHFLPLNPDEAKSAALF